MTMNYYKVVAVCGHVGAGKEVSATFGIKAKDVYSAMVITRNMPMVKHNRGSCIKSVETITEQEYAKLRRIGAYNYLKSGDDYAE